MKKEAETTTQDRIAALPCWNGAIEVAPLSGGISNESHLVRDASGRHVVRFGQDYPFHHVYRDRELMTARAAFEAGFAPRVEYAEPGVMVSAFIDGRTFGAEDVARERQRVAKLLRAFHTEMPRRVSGTAFLFWPFHVIRDYVRTLEAGGSRMKQQLPRYLTLIEELEAAQVPLPVIFAHNDLLPANILDDGERLWLIDFEYAGFSTPMFDLAGATSNANLTPSESEDFLTAYFGRKPDPEIRRSLMAMQCASLLREATWGMVSELYLAAPGADYHAYTIDNLMRLKEALNQYRNM